MGYVRISTIHFLKIYVIFNTPKRFFKINIFRLIINIIVPGNKMYFCRLAKPGNTPIKPKGEAT